MTVIAEALSPTGASGEGSLSVLGGEPRLPTDIPRPYSLSAKLLDRGSSLLIDDQIIMACGYTHDGMAQRFGRIPVFVKTLLISRDVAVPIRIQKNDGDGSEFRVPCPNNGEASKGKIGTLFVYERKRPRVCYIGEDYHYQVTLLSTQGPDMQIIIQSVSPLKPKRISGRLNREGLLRELISQQRSL